MGPGRKPRKEPSDGQRVAGCRMRFNGAWAKTQEGTASTNAAAISNATVLQWGLGENPGRNHGLHPLAGRMLPPLQWGLGENPGRNRTLRTRIRPGWTPCFNGAWAKTQEGTVPEAEPAAPIAESFNGAWAKTQEGTEVQTPEAPFVGHASMGPGRKPRKEHRWHAWPTVGTGACFNGAWAKTQEGTGGGPGRWRYRRVGFNGAWAKTQEGTCSGSGERSG